MSTTYTVEKVGCKDKDGYLRSLVIVKHPDGLISLEMRQQPAMVDIINPLPSDGAQTALYMNSEQVEQAISILAGLIKD